MVYDVDQTVWYSIVYSLCDYVLPITHPNLHNNVYIVTYILLYAPYIHVKVIGMLRDKQPRLGQVLESATVLARECGEVVQRCIRLDQEDLVYPLTVMVCMYVLYTNIFVQCTHTVCGLCRVYSTYSLFIILCPAPLRTVIYYIYVYHSIML